MIARRRGALPLFVSTLSVLLVAGCRVDEDAFQARIFTCDKSSPAPTCGSDAEGHEMTCYAASQLGANDFCVAECPPQLLVSEQTSNGASVCVSGNAQLSTCDPMIAGSCGPSLGCLRTDVVTDEGVCLTMNPCTEDKDCRDTVQSTCASTFLNELYSDNHDLRSDHLYCLQRNCQSGGSSCNPGQACLPNLVDKAAHPPDICVPNCGSAPDYLCPPNHFCFRKLSGTGSPPICLPGLLGFLCESNIDCMVGTCESDNGPEGLALNLCTVPCDSTVDCEKWDSDQGKFVCIDHTCRTPDAYRGARCSSDADCTRDLGTQCVFSSKPNKVTDLGTCSTICGDGTGPDTPCAPRGGFGQVCQTFTVDHDGHPKHACFPGYFNFFFTCTSNADCIDDLQCLDTGNGRHCTVPCASDAACQMNRWTRGASSCVVVGNGAACAPPTPQQTAAAPLPAEMM